MAQRYFITLSYDGTNYHGWQVQPNGNSVQEELQRALSLLLREPIAITGAGRTDAGVHARMMVAHFDTDQPVDCAQLAYKLNRLLPKDIAVQRVEPVEAEMHARFSATSRTYHYFIHTRKDPFCRQYSCELHYDLDFELMNEAAQVLMEYVVGTLVDVGRHRLTVNDFRRIVEGKQRTDAGESMPGCALFLVDVRYGE